MAEATVTLESDEEPVEAVPEPVPPIVVAAPDPLPDPITPADDVAGAVAATAAAVADAVGTGQLNDHSAEILSELHYLHECLDRMANTPEPEPVVVADDAEIVEEDVPPSRHHKWFQSIDELRGR